MVHLGLGRHVQLLDPSVFETFFILTYVVEMLFIGAITMVKCSILAFYYRLFQVTSIRKPIFLVAGVVIAWAIASVSHCTISFRRRACLMCKTLLATLQCIPPKKLWHPTDPGSCLNLHTLSLGTAIPEVITDFVILAMPLPYIWHLQIKLRQKLILIGIFVVGGSHVFSSQQTIQS